MLQSQTRIVFVLGHSVMRRQCGISGTSWSNTT